MSHTWPGLYLSAAAYLRFTVHFQTASDTCFLCLQHFVFNHCLYFIPACELWWILLYFVCLFVCLSLCKMSLKSFSLIFSTTTLESRRVSYAVRNWITVSVLNYWGGEDTITELAFPWFRKFLNHGNAIFDSSAMNGKVFSGKHQTERQNAPCNSRWGDGWHTGS